MSNISNFDWTGLGSIATGLINSITQGVISKKNFNEMKRQYENNMKFQREQFDYQKELNQKMIEREDNAVVRRMKDLNNAGINPLMADGQSASAGGGTSTSFTGTDAAQMEMFDTSTILGAFLDSQRVRNEKAQTKIEKERLEMQQLNSAQDRLESLSRQILNTKELEVKDALIKQYNANVALINKQSKALNLNMEISEWSGLPVGTDPRVNNAYQATSGALIAAAKKISDVLNRWNDTHRNYTFRQENPDDNTGHIAYDEKEGEWYEIVRSVRDGKKFKIYANGKRVEIK